MRPGRRARAKESAREVVPTGKEGEIERERERERERWEGMERGREVGREANPEFAVRAEPLLLNKLSDDPTVTVNSSVTMTMSVTVTGYVTVTVTL